MAQKCLSCFIILLFLSGIGYSQPDWIVSGRVTDSLGTPLELAVVYTTPDTSERFLAFA